MNQQDRQDQMKKKVLWASRHALDQAAEETLQSAVCEQGPCEYEQCDGNCPSVILTKKEVLWPSDKQDCRDLALALHQEFNVLAGVWPAQAIEAFRYADRCNNWDDLHYVPVISPVSVPETEPDVKKVRPFRFVRWAWVA